MLAKNAAKMKKAFIIHGWSGKPDKGFRPWLKTELEKHGYSVEVPAMPDSDHPTVEAWIFFLQQQIRIPDEHTVLVGHSLGAPAILMYLEKLPEGVTIDKAILVAGSFTTIRELTPEKKVLARPWLEKNWDYEKIRRSAKSIVAFYSDDDPWVPIENSEVPKKLGAKIIIEHGMKHYNEDAGIREVPAILKEILSN